MPVKEILVRELLKPRDIDLLTSTGWRKNWIDNQRDILGWSDGYEHLALYNAARIGLGDLIEIGSFLGRSTVHLAAGLKVSGREGTLHAIDPFFDPFVVSYDGVPANANPPWLQSFNPRNGTIIKDTKNIFLANIKKCSVDDRISVHHITAYETHNFFQNDSVGVLFIDGDHRYENVKQDFVFYFPKVIHGGLIIFHDVVQSHSGVMQFVQELGEDKHNGLEEITNISSLGIYRKIVGA